MKLISPGLSQIELTRTQVCDRTGFLYGQFLGNRKDDINLEQSNTERDRERDSWSPTNLKSCPSDLRMSLQDLLQVLSYLNSTTVGTRLFNKHSTISMLILTPYFCQQRCHL